MRKPIIALSALLGLGQAQAELVVVAHPATKISSIKHSDLNRLFMGQANSLPDGSRAQPFNVSGERRDQFYQQMLGKTPVQMERYWARMIFTGKAQPLREISAKELKAVLADTPGAISYLHISQVDASVKVLRVESGS